MGCGVDGGRRLAAGVAVAALYALTACGGSGVQAPNQNSNPAPVVTGLSPSLATPGAAAQPLAISGTGFISTSAASFNGTSRTTTFVSATQLTIQLSAADQATPGTYQVTVTNPSPGGGTSSPVAFTVSGYPVPSITSLSPASAVAGSGAQTLTVNGTGFVSISVVSFNATARTTAFVSASQLTIQLTAADVADGASYPVLVTNGPAGGGGGGSSSTVQFVVNNPTPAITSFSPASTVTGQDSAIVTINGSGFVPSSKVSVSGGPPSTPASYSATQLTIIVKGSPLSAAGTIVIAVTNPTPGGGTTQANYTVVDACTYLATSLPYNPSGLGFALYRPVLDQSSVYWVDFANGQSAIKKVPKTGGSVTVLASGLGAVNQIAVDDANVYWTEFVIANGNGSIKSVPKNGGSVSVLATGTPSGSIYDVFVPGGITLDASYVYWGEGVGGGAIRRVAKTGGQVVDIGRGQGSVAWVVLDSVQAYFYYFDAMVPANVFRLPFAGGIPQSLALMVGTNVVGGLALDANFVYWVDLVQAGSVFKVPTTGGSPTYLVTNLANPHNVAIDASYVYYPVQGGAHSTYKLPKAGGSATPLPSCGAATAGGVSQAAAITLAVDAAFVYAVGYNNGSTAALVFRQSK